MKSFKVLANGVRKHFAWGYSEVYADFSKCFTDEELDEVILHLSELRRENALDPSEIQSLARCIAERKRRIKPAKP